MSKTCPLLTTIHSVLFLSTLSHSDILAIFTYLALDDLTCLIFLLKTEICVPRLYPFIYLVISIIVAPGMYYIDIYLLAACSSCKYIATLHIDICNDKLTLNTNLNSTNLSVPKLCDYRSN